MEGKSIALIAVLFMFAIWYSYSGRRSGGPNVPQRGGGEKKKKDMAAVWAARPVAPMPKSDYDAPRSNNVAQMLRMGSEI